MASFCGQCGARNDGGRFCTSCGGPLATSPAPAPPATPTSPPAAPAPQPTVPAAPQPTPQAAPQPTPPPAPQPPPAQQPWTAQPSWTAQPPYGAPSPRPTVPRTNPFVGVPVGDYVRDAVAVFCLFAALAMPWDLPANDGADRWWVVLAVLVSVASLALPYLGRSQVVPGWTPQVVRLLKLAANAPFAACVVAALVNELVNVSEPLSGGIGTGVAMGVAGATLAVQPRQADEDPGHRDDPTWLLATNVLTGAAAVAVLIAFAAHFVHDQTEDFGYLLEDAMLFVYVVLGVPVAALVSITWPAIASLGGSAAWRRVFAAVGASVLVAALFSLAGDGDGVFTALAVEKWHSPVGGTVLVAAAAALAVSRPAQRRAASLEAAATGWIRTAVTALQVAAATLAVAAATVAVGMIAAEEVEAPAVVVVVLLLVSAGIGLAVVGMLAQVQRTRSTAVGLLAVQLLLAVITLAVAGAQDVYFGVVVDTSYGFGLQASGWAVAMWFTLPGLALFALVGPGSVRSALGPLVVERPAAPQQPQAPYGQQQPPPPYGHQQPPPPQAPGWPPTQG